MHAPVGFVAEEARGQHGVDVGVDRHRVRWLNLINLALPPIDALVQEKSSLERLARWRAMPEPDPRSTLEVARLIVVDIESTGLDPNADRLRAIGAMTVQGEKIHLGRSVQATLGEPESSQRNGALVDGTGIVSERDAMLAFLEFAGKAPLVGYNVEFVDGMIRRAAAQHLGEYYRPRWIDLADLARQLVPDQMRRRTSLDTTGSTVSALRCLAAMMPWPVPWRERNSCSPSWVGRRSSRGAWRNSYGNPAPRAG
jgi:DNA polymerase-3 subunit epsilon